MELHDVLPLDEIRSRFEKPVSCVQLRLPEYRETVRLEPNCIGGASLNIWNRIVNGGKLGVNKFAGARNIEPTGIARPEIVEGSSAIITEPLIKDV